MLSSGRADQRSNGTETRQRAALEEFNEECEPRQRASPSALGGLLPFGTHSPIELGGRRRRVYRKIVFYHCMYPRVAFTIGLVPMGTMVITTAAPVLFLLSAKTSRSRLARRAQSLTGTQMWSPCGAMERDGDPAALQKRLALVEYAIELW